MAVFIVQALSTLASQEFLRISKVLPFLIKFLEMYEIFEILLKIRMLKIFEDFSDIYYMFTAVLHGGIYKECKSML